MHLSLVQDSEHLTMRVNAVIAPWLIRKDYGSFSYVFVSPFGGLEASVLPGVRIVRTALIHSRTIGSSTTSRKGLHLYWCSLAA
jgi:hypothetical protein